MPPTAATAAATTTTTTKTFPFTDSRADVIIRSSDNVDYRVHKYMLSFSSTCFSDMFQLPQAQGQNDLPVVPVTEDSAVLEKLLLFCYPCDRPQLETLDETIKFLEAGRKYGMDNIKDAARAALPSVRIASPNPLAAIVAALKYEMDAEAKEIARYLLEKDSIPLTAPEIDDMSASELAALMRYHAACCDAASRVVSDPSTQELTCALFNSFARSNTLSTASSLAAGGGHPCTCHKRQWAYGRQAFDAPRWWLEFADEVAWILGKMPAPHGTQIKNAFHMGLYKARSCASCSSKGCRSLAQFLAFIQEEVERAISEVPLNISD
ncbi:hypothetical protein CONPUDRAFT_129640 [Coniophora puteana RWD-64-598 SS2]|uniref:BTB domain-containing protein n=1 Tax=Coniophora puteana (strain RWD-64-598) TaxID=741705 RepID=A0A5M3MEE5_CONPW|nr:uncharacterized protein CONPUDRAFT_129640 [Coniophora puteana RWD-64-598 SS2]EIW77376.1 hypothetical protein CONPUDRAFT_129640 [Coniophora puteana RWD-64-598 SS2]